MPRQQLDEYTEQLARVAQTNFLEGLSVLQKAQLLSRQNDATVQTLTEFNRKKNLLDGEVKTTEQQINELKDTELFKGAEDDIAETIIQLQSSIDNSLTRQEAFTKLSQTAALQLESIGSERSIALAKIIRQQDIDILQMKKDLYEIEGSKLHNTKYQMELAILQKNSNVSNLAVQMMADDAYMQRLQSNYYKQVYSAGQEKKISLFNNEDLYKSMFAKFGGQKYFREAFALVLSKIPEAQPIRPEEPRSSSGASQMEAMQDMYDRLNYLDKYYTYLKDTSSDIVQIEQEKGTAIEEIRDLYRQVAESIYGKYDPANKNKVYQEKFHFGRDPNVNARLKDPDVLNTFKNKRNETITGATVGQVFFSPFEIADYVYTRKYNVSESNKENYFRNFDYFISKFPTKDGQPQAFDKPVSIDELGRVSPNYLRYPNPITGQVLQYDLSKLINGKSKVFYQPHYENLGDIFDAEMKDTKKENLPPLIPAHKPYYDKYELSWENFWR